MESNTQTLNFYDLYRYADAGDLKGEPSGHTMAQKFGRINPRFKNDHRRIPTNPFKEDPGNRTYKDDKITMELFLQDPDVRTALHIPTDVKTFRECINSTESPDWKYTV
jgi:hypothetical protein